jgi:hypothetical protein
VVDNLLHGEVDDCDLGDGAGGGFDGDLRGSGWGGCDEAGGVAGAAGEEAGGEDHCSEEAEETEGALLAG